MMPAVSVRPTPTVTGALRPGWPGRAHTASPPAPHWNRLSPCATLSGEGLDRADLLPRAVSMLRIVDACIRQRQERGRRVALEKLGLCTEPGGGARNAPSLLGNHGVHVVERPQRPRLSPAQTKDPASSTYRRALSLDWLRARNGIDPPPFDSPHSRGLPRRTGPRGADLRGVRPLADCGLRSLPGRRLVRRKPVRHRLGRPTTRCRAPGRRGQRRHTPAPADPSAPGPGPAFGGRSSPTAGRRPAGPGRGASSRPGSPAGHPPPPVHPHGPPRRPGLPCAYLRPSPPGSARSGRRYGWRLHSACRSRDDVPLPPGPAAPDQQRAPSRP